MIYLLFFLSGAAGLLYEIVWSRSLGLLFGHTVHAAAVVLGAYFAGMALGYLLAGRLAGRLKRPLYGYGAAELGVAAWALATPAILKLFTQPPLAAWLNHPQPELQLAIRAALAFLVLLPATVALGATLPFVAQHVAGTGRVAAPRIALAYACNTAGAFCGVLAATFVLILWLGVQASGELAAAISAACGIGAILLARQRAVTRKDEPAPAAGPLAAQPDAGPQRSLYLLAALSGFGTLGLQVLYTRMFALTFHNSTYTFGGVVAVFLLALSAGSALAARLGRRWPPLNSARWACGLGAASVLLSVSLFQHFTRLGYFTAPGGFATYVLCALGLIAAVVFLPTLLLGAVLPLCYLAARQEGSIGAMVGRITAVNTLAAAAGALATSLLLLPLLGLWRCFALLATMYLLAHILRPQAAGVRRAWAYDAVLCLLVAGTAAAVLSWPQSVVSRRAELLFERETPYGLITVQQGADGELQLRENNHYVLGGNIGGGSEFLQGRLPLLLHPAPREVAFLGLATGITASAAIADPAVEHCTAIELIPEVVEAARLFKYYNAGLLDHPQVELVANDARHYLYATPRNFDVIVSDLFVPWHSQTGYLYTVEHYRAARARLRPGGLFCQWLPLYQLGPREFELIADSFASVFAVTTVWRGELGLDGAPLMALIGSEQQLKLDALQLDARIAQLTDTPWDTGGLLASPEGMLKLYVGTWPPPGASAGLWNTDDHPRVEFLAPISSRERVLLKGPQLSQYYLDVLSRLAPAGVQYTPRPGKPALSLTANQLGQLRGD